MQPSWQLDRGEGDMTGGGGVEKPASMVDSLGGAVTVTVEGAPE